MYPDLRFISFCCLVYCLVALGPEARSAGDGAAAPAARAAVQPGQHPAFPEIERRAAAQEGLSARDKSFLMTAAQSEMLQLELSRVALAHARNPALRRFASATARFTGSWKARLDHVAEEFGVSFPGIVPDDVQQAQAALGTAKDIDRDYLMRILADTKTVSSLYKDEAVKGANPVVAQYAQSMLPRLSQHYRNTMQMSAAISGPVLATRRGVPRTQSKS